MLCLDQVLTDLSYWLQTDVDFLRCTCIWWRWSRTSLCHMVTYRHSLLTSTWGWSTGWTLPQGRCGVESLPILITVWLVIARSVNYCVCLSVCFVTTTAAIKWSDSSLLSSFLTRVIHVAIGESILWNLRQSHHLYVQKYTDFNVHI